MVDVADKAVTKRVALAAAVLELPPTVSAALRAHMAETTGGAVDADSALRSWQTKKGPILSTSVVAATMAVKATSNTIPFCHPLPIEGCKVESSVGPDFSAINFTVRVTTTHKTGVEMEALHGATVAALTAYDMLKGIEGAQPGLTIRDVRLLEKTGGKSDVASRSAREP